MTIHEYEYLQNLLTDLLKGYKLKDKNLTGKRLEGFEEGVKSCKSVLHGKFSHEEINNGTK